MKYLLIPAALLAASIGTAAAAPKPAQKAEAAPKPAATAPVFDEKLREQAKRAIDRGLHYLRENQAEDGSWSRSVGITALALRAFLESPRKYNEGDGAFITRPVQYLLSHVRKDGAISAENQNLSYTTAVAITALQATGNPKYQDTIKAGQKFLTGHQIDEGEGYAKDHRYYGGIGYGGDERPDLSNAYLAVEALKATALDPKDPAWEKALVFIDRCQNRSESNDQSWAGNDGGFTYMPGWSPYGGTGSYGAMTHAGLIGLLFAGVDKNDPRIQAAREWIRNNYTLEENPGVPNKQALFYYYNSFAKSMSAFGEPEITDGKGAKHDWRADLAQKLIGLQEPDGSWVNSTAKWMENDKNLATSWSVIALDLAMR
jgi:squalene-hopene/tetraprenyl-beta-curcumene cyclase